MCARGLRGRLVDERRSSTPTVTRRAAPGVRVLSVAPVGGTDASLPSRGGHGAAVVTMSS
ncbi:hypothetical protein A5766_23465 [Gordonia sp. 852002-51296_SCH5728562-b]|nr:hypothetical protein A5766_23465 [Gordonia sp. 852002-51296_SCH5728562-b]